MTIDEELSAREFLAAYNAGRRVFHGVEVTSEIGDDVLVGAVLDDLYFRHSFISTNLQGASLQRANFGPANVKTCAFDGADLTDADFRGAALCATSFLGSIMSGARFDGAYYHGVEMSGGEQPHW